MIWQKHIFSSWPVNIETLVPQKYKDTNEYGEDDQVKDKRGHKRRSRRT